jgi:hypothetical protein
MKQTSGCVANGLDGIDERWPSRIDLTVSSTLADASATRAGDRAAVDAEVKEQSGAAGDHAATQKRATDCKSAAQKVW